MSGLEASFSATTPGKEAIFDFYFFLLIIGGHVGLPLALATILFAKSVPRRHPTLINVLVCWIIYATASLLLLYSGQQAEEHPEFGICLAQASFVYASTVMVATASLCLVLQLWIEFNRLRFKCVQWIRDSQMCNLLLLSLPWIAFFIYAAVSITSGSQEPSTVSFDWKFYCTIESTQHKYTVSGTTLVLLGISVMFEVDVLRVLYRHSTRQFRAANRTSYHLALRVAVFAIYSIITFIFSILRTFRPTLIFPYVFIGTLPLAAFFIFGTQRENLHVWFMIRHTTQMPVKPMAVKLTATQEAISNMEDFDSDKSLPKITGSPEDV